MREAVREAVGGWQSVVSLLLAVALIVFGVLGLLGFVGREVGLVVLGVGLVVSVAMLVLRVRSREW